MSLAPNSVWTIGHVSVLRTAPALFIGVSRLHRTTLFQQSLRVFPTFIQKEAPKAMIIAPTAATSVAVAPKAVSPLFVSKLIDAETRQRHRIKRMTTQRINQRNVKRLALTIYSVGPALCHGYTGSNYDNSDSEDTGESGTNPCSWILRVFFQGLWSGFFAFIYDVLSGRETWGLSDEEEDWDENDEIRELEEENDELREEVRKLRRENSKLKGQSEEEFEDEEFDRLVNG